MNVLILGCGYTGERVRARFLARGANVTGTHRDWPLEDVRRHVTPGVLVLHSAPPPANVLDALGDAPARVVYLSSTGVYGKAHVVDETTPIDPDAAPERMAEEQRVLTGPWSPLVLRPAAIYGPRRGVHERVLRGEPCPAGENFVSRIHVDDLAAHVEAALLSDVTGAYPVADEEPCTSREIAEYCAAMFGRSVVPAQTRARADRKVDGSAIRRLLGITLRYPSYWEGIQAAASSPAVK